MKRTHGDRIAESNEPARLHMAHDLQPGGSSIQAPFASMLIAAASILGLAQVAMGDLPPVPVPPENPITEPKRILGKILFFEEQLSSTNTMACATCHVSGRAGTDPRTAGHPGPDGIPQNGDDKLASAGIIRSNAVLDLLRDATFGTRPQVTDRTANSMINAAYAPQLFWDGRASGQFRDPQTGQVLIPTGGALESQAAAPPANSIEMAHDGINWTDITTKLVHARPLELATSFTADISTALADAPDYPELFRRAFGDDSITASRIAMAIATYERTLISDQSPWDSFMAGNPNAMTQQQRNGWQAFQTSRCDLCHIPPLFTGNGFRNIGLRPPAEDRGLANVTGNNNDRGKFKVPGLRNVGLKASYMHTGRLPDLREVLRFYAGALQQFPDNQDPIMGQVNVPPPAAVVIEEFLRNGLLDPRVRDQTFPFDKPTLASERPQHRTTNLGGGVPGTGGQAPRLIADHPPMLGTRDFRVGIDLARVSTRARLAYSTTPPSGGSITPTAFVGEITTSTGPVGTGMGTFHWELSPSLFTSGQIIYLQWFIDDPIAASGEARSEVARVPIFCGAWGCPESCPSDIDGSGFVDSEDFRAFVARFEAGTQDADFDLSGFVDLDDFDAFVRAFENGC
jgi:cytochrome c peroxidase